MILNDSIDYRLDSMQFGSVKSSGLGREGLRLSLQEMTEPKVVCWYLPGVKPVLTGRRNEEHETVIGVVP